MINPNQELLDFAVKNVEWNDNYTHLRSDGSSDPLFFSNGEGWYLNTKDEWRLDYSNTYYTALTIIPNFSTSPQVISKEEYLEAKDNLPLSQDKEYSIKLTGEDLVLLEMLTGRTNGFKFFPIYQKFEKYVKGNGIVVDYDDLPMIMVAGIENIISDKLNEVFSPPIQQETEEQRNLRELKEQYEVLGEKIKAMEGK